MYFNFKKENLINAEYKSFVVTITKDTAKEMLLTSIGNRKINKENVNALKRDIDNNDYHYQTPGSGIAFNKDARLVNGHHTLTAFVHSNKDTLTLNITVGAEYLDKCDTGKSRTLGESAVMCGHGELEKIVKLAANILRIRKNLVLTNSGVKKTIPNQEIFSFAEDNKEELFEIYDKIQNFKDTNKGNYIPSYPKFEISVIGAVAWNLIHEKNYNKEEVYYFMTSMMLFGGGNNPHKIISKLYKKLDKDSRARKPENMSFDAFKDLVISSYEKYSKEINKINKCAC